MKIVHSFWTKPIIKTGDYNSSDRFNGGWLDKKYNYFSWALSCLTFSEFYSQVELYTDIPGAELLIHKLQLPYSKVHVVLDNLNNYHPDLWAIGKLYTYSLQDEPFLHVDGDVFIWKKFEEEWLKGKLLAQNFENDFNYYKDTYKEIREQFHYMPTEILNYYKENKVLPGINAGIIGGNDLCFINRYARAAFKFIDNNINNITRINIGLFNNFYEQCMFKILADQDNISINYLRNKVNDRFDGFVDFTGIPSNIWYIHTCGSYKKRLETGELLAYRLKSEYPDYYYRIISLLKNYII